MTERAEPLPNGQELALRMQAAYPRDDWIGLLAMRSGEPRGKIEWHLQQEMVPTGPMLLAAGELLSEVHQHNANPPAEPHEP